MIRTEPKPICFLCGTEGKVLYENLKDYSYGVSGSWNLKLCPNSNCGLIWLDPMPMREYLKNLYESYHTHQETYHGNGRSFNFQQRIKNNLISNAFGYKSNYTSNAIVSLLGHILIKSNFIRERISRSVMWLSESHKGRLLDVGCGNGVFLSGMRDLGWDVTGFETDEKAAIIGREKYNLNIHTGTFNNFTVPDDSFDAVTMCHVLEHLHDPLQALKTVHSLLNKNGQVIIVTPNSLSLGHRWFKNAWRGLEPPRHLHIYSPNSIINLAHQVNFRVSELRIHAITASSMWARSASIKQVQQLKGNSIDDLSNKFKMTGFLFAVLEHILTGWPFQYPWGEEMVLIAEKE